MICKLKKIYLFNIYINDLFLFSEDFLIANYADDCSPYEFSLSIDDVIGKPQLKPNPVKWHLLLIEIGDQYFVNMGSKCIFNSNEEKILGVYFDNKLYFKCHLHKLCKRACIKLHALARISNFMSLSSNIVFSYRCVTAGTFTHKLTKFTKVL